MYISALDRPWEQTPFPIKGFYVRDLAEVRKLKTHCKFVFIDTVKGTEPSSIKSAKENKEDIYGGKLAPIYADNSIHTCIEPIANEMSAALHAYDDMIMEMNIVMGQIAQKTVVTLRDFIHASYLMVESIIRNPDAFLWLVRVRKMDEADPYYYLLRSTAWALVFGRHLGLSKSNLRILALSMLFKDVGKLTLPKVLLSQKAGNPSDSGIGQIIVEQTINFLKEYIEIPPKVIKTISSMFERVNGSGYPKRLNGDEIPFLSKIASIAAFYDEETYLKGELCSIPSSQSVARLYDVRGVQFQDDLVVEFIKALGLYPTGTLVKLSTKEIAIVTEQNYTRRLKPRVLVVVDKNNEAVERFDYIDLAVGDTRSIVPPSPPKVRRAEAQIPTRVDLVEAVQPYDYPIKVAKIRTVHIHNQCEMATQ